MKNNKNEESRNERQEEASNSKSRFYYPEVTGYIKRKRQITPKICAAELARSLIRNQIAKHITKNEVREILLELR